tara:strand:- start:34085 stop:35086 length:1002 start_codon:yes stop_codon:yes gene_type:complete
MLRKLFFLGLILNNISASNAKTASAESIYNYLMPAKTITEFAIINTDENQRKNLVEAINSGKVSEKLERPVITADKIKNILTIKGNWGEFEINYSLSDSKSIIINGKKFPLKSAYKLEEFSFAPKASRFSIFGFEVYAANDNWAMRFFSSVAAAATDRWNNTVNDTSKRINFVGLMRGLQCEDKKPSQVIVGQDQVALKLIYNARGLVNRIDMSDANGNKCILHFDPKENISAVDQIRGDCSPYKKTMRHLDDSIKETARYTSGISVSSVLLNVSSLMWSGPSYIEILKDCCTSSSCQQNVQKQIDKNNKDYLNVAPSNGPAGPRKGSAIRVI